MLKLPVTYQLYSNSHILYIYQDIETCLMRECSRYSEVSHLYGLQDFNHQEHHYFLNLREVVAPSRVHQSQTNRGAWWSPSKKK